MYYVSYFKIPVLYLTLTLYSMLSVISLSYLTKRISVNHDTIRDHSDARAHRY